MKTKTVILIIVIAVIIAAIAGLLALRQSRKSGPSPIIPVPQDVNVPEIEPAGPLEVGEMAPDFELEALDGSKVRLSDYKGQPVMIDFWADWCPFCVGEFPEMEKAYLKYRDQGFIILGVHRTATESRDTAQAFADKAGVTFPILLDPADEVYETYLRGQGVMPMSIFIDGKGEIRDRILGPKDLDRLEQKILEIL